LIIINLIFAIHIFNTINFNSKEREISPNKRDCLFSISPRGGISDSWDKVDVFVNSNLCTLTGTTYDGVFVNNTDYEISNWNLKIEITEPCFINKAWCGLIEIHQFRSGREKVQLLDLRNITKKDLQLEYSEVGQDLLITLKNGDYLIYKPSIDASEYPVNAFNGSAGTVTIGLIFYYLKNQKFDISNFSVKYKFNKSFYQGIIPKIYFATLAILLFALIIQFSMRFAYKKAKIEAEKLMNIQKIHDLEQFNEEIRETNRQLEETNSVISAISEIYINLYKVNLENDTFTCVRASEIVFKYLSKFKKASVALSELPKDMFVEEDQRKVSEFYKVSTWKEKLSKNDICSADFRGRYTGWVRTNLIVAKRNSSGEAIEVLAALQDVDKIVKEEQDKKIRLEKANKIMQSFNQTLNSELKERTLHIKEIQQKVVRGLAGVIGNRDPDTGGHVNRTSDIIKIIVDEIREQNPNLISDEKVNDIIRAAPMHDLGKIYIPENILRKPGKLTDEEYETMKLHSQTSGDIVNLILKDVEEQHFVDTAFNVARHHHERWDGNGYPDKLKGEEIPLEARIMAVADVYDALVSRRCYKQPMSFEKAYEIMCNGMGTQFDPKMKQTFISCRTRLEAYYLQNN